MTTDIDANEKNPECIFYCAQDGALLKANPAALRHIGAKNHKEIVGLSVFALAAKDQHKQLRTALISKHGSMECHLSTLAGQQCWLKMLFAPAPDNSHHHNMVRVVAFDITEYKNLEARFARSEARLADTQAQARLGNWHLDLRTNEIEWSDEMFHLLNLTPVNPPPHYTETAKHIHPDDKAQAIKLYEIATKYGTEYSQDIRLPQPDGSIRWVETRCESVLDDEGNVVILFGMVQDITPRKYAEQAELDLLTASKLLYQSQKIAKVGGWEFDIATNHLFWTEETYRILDTSPDQILDLTIDGSIEFFLPKSRITISKAHYDALTKGHDYDLELEALTKTGRRIDVRTTCSVTFDKDKPVKLTGIFQDISSQKNIQRELEHSNRELERTNEVLENIAHYDALTHLPNRTLLADRMQQALVFCRRHKTSIAVAFLDLDGFKEVNDTHGHSVGDELLVVVANRIKNTLRQSDTFARIGGDEFVAVLAGLREHSDCEEMLSRMLNAISNPIQLGENVVQISASIGVTIYPLDDVDAEQLLRHADQAMYVAKQSGKNCIHVFDVAKDVAFKTQREELENIRIALENNEFVLFYQPKVNMQAGAIIGAEALIRWQHPERGLLSPAVFLPVIEDDDLSIEIGEWVITTALKQMQAWRKVGIQLPVSVNIGAYQLQQTNFVQRLENILNRFGDAHAHDLELEIIETSALSDIAQVSAVMEACQALGVDFALDDFGTGYSSLTYLKRLPAGLLKIDQSFVRGMLDDPDDLAIIKGIIGLAEAFHRNVIAEGVETVEHIKQLLSLGCVYAQGFGIARPMPAADIEHWVTNWKPYHIGHS